MDRIQGQTVEVHVYSAKRGRSRCRRPEPYSEKTLARLSANLRLTTGTQVRQGPGTATMPATHHSTRRMPAFNYQLRNPARIELPERVTTLQVFQGSAGMGMRGCEANSPRNSPLRPHKSVSLSCGQYGASCSTMLLNVAANFCQLEDRPMVFGDHDCPSRGRSTVTHHHYYCYFRCHPMPYSTH
jgi:hypothetical protein